MLTHRGEMGLHTLEKDLMKDTKMNKLVIQDRLMLAMNEVKRDKYEPDQSDDEEYDSEALLLEAIER